MSFNKFHASSEVVDGIRFASRREAKRYRELKLLEKAGEISNLELQPRFPIVINGEPVRAWSCARKGRPLMAIMDFRYNRKGQRVVEDVKGVDLPLSRWKRAIVEHIYSVTVEVVK